MRTFYVYNVKDFVYSLYEKYPYQLYKMLEDAYLTNKYDMVLSSSYYGQITNNFNKLFMNHYIMANHKLNGYYYKKDNTHVITSNQEYSKLMIGSHFLKLKSNINYPCFFDTIKDFRGNIFVCDFENQDYFWLEVVSSNNKKIFVKE